MGADLGGARHALAVALVDVAETAVESGQPLPCQINCDKRGNGREEPIYLTSALV